MQILFKITFACSVLFSALAQHAYADFYRHVDETGTRHVSTTLTKPALKYGYEILNNQMMVMKRVPPELTLEEKNKVAQEKADAEAKTQLLATYSSSKNAISVRDRKIKAMEVRMNITTSDLTRLNSEYEGVASEAAQFMQRNEKVPNEINSKFRRIELLTEQSKTSLLTQQKEIEDVRNKFNVDIEKLKVIEHKQAMNEKALDQNELDQAAVDEQTNQTVPTE
ncbi:MAG: hypothetical protein V4629_08135 [Pseudomonadota bacterium]